MAKTPGLTVGCPPPTDRLGWPAAADGAVPGAELALGTPKLATEEAGPEAGPEAADDGDAGTAPEGLPTATLELPQLPTGSAKAPSEDFCTSWPGLGNRMSFESGVVQPLPRLATNISGKELRPFCLLFGEVFGVGMYLFCAGDWIVAGPQFM